MKLNSDQLFKQLDPMKLGSNQIFKQMDPPAGGVESMRERMEQGPRWVMYDWPALAMTLALVYFTVLLVPRTPDQVPLPDEAIPEVTPEKTGLYLSNEFDFLLGRTSSTVDLTVQVNGESVPVVSRNDVNNTIRIYELSAITPAGT